VTSDALVVTVLGSRELVLTRSFHAPRPLVFEALTRPELLKRWFGARGWNLVECEVDLRVGGAWRPMERGLGESYERLAAVLAAGATTIERSAT